MPAQGAAPASPAAPPPAEGGAKVPEALPPPPGVALPQPQGPAPAAAPPHAAANPGGPAPPAAQAGAELDHLAEGGAVEPPPPVPAPVPAAPPAPVQRPEQALVLHLLAPPRTGQLLVAALYPAVDCGGPMQVHWHGQQFTSFAVKDGWSHVLLPVALTTRPGSYPLSVRCGAREASFQVAVEAGIYPESQLKVAPQFTGKPPARAASERQAIASSLRLSQSSRLWTQSFCRPTAGGSTSPFGVRRTFNGRLKSRHLGEDFAGRVGDGVWAANDGVVALAASDYFYTGNAVFIDHGHQLYTMYFHLSDMRVKTGDKVVRGQLIGALGSSGRVTGPHVHFAVKLAGTYVDPQDLLDYEPHLPLGSFRFIGR